MDELLPQEPPINRIFGTLRKIWKESAPERKYQDLAAQLSVYLGIKVTPQKLSQWATGSDHRRPPWAAIYWLMAATQYDVKLGTEGARLVRRREQPRVDEVEAADQTGE